MPGCFIHIWLFLFAVFTREIEVKEVQTGLYSRVELTGGELDQHTADSLHSVEWTKQNGSITCLCFKKNTTFSAAYSQCCGTAHFYLNNNSLILENVTAKDEGFFTETIVRGNGTTNMLSFTLIIQYPLSVTEIVVSWTSSTSVTLKCEVSGLFLYLMWKREGFSILEKHRHSFSERNQTLHISNITSSDYGTYSCFASNAYGESEKHTYITGENSTVNRGNGTGGQTQSDQIVLSSGLTLAGVLGLCIVFYCLYKNHHRQRAENGRTTDEGGADNDLGIYQEVPVTEEVTPLPYVYTDFIKPKESSQASAAATHFEDFGYSEVGPTCREETAVLYERVSNEQSTACPDAGEV
ncbi:leucine-rich repeats and immunoglobulin-like domains protein 1 [Sinocyclocheilus grahami]|uniref:leucine-rich repeats and immunoglobulin-like domains protein 1 n=1 Tax=Sinocyclocheilus grahami TaxID=75366 RepID=UPI0007ACF3C9|nr:PREDICTED: leucine-rich repeats and immunoglobulin-like domains protein 1 [Sinocyclocheilus grahami]